MNTERGEHFFEDYAEHFYSSVTYDRFFEVVGKKEQLSRLLMSGESLRMLQDESKKYQKTMYAAIAASALLVYPLGKLMPVGFKGKIATFVLGVGMGMMGGALWAANDYCRQKMLALKQKVYSENRPNFRKYELTGDIKLANPNVILVDE